jgi:hypothetical protein
MEDKKQLIVTHIKERIETTKELDKMYSEEKINKLAENLLTTNKPLQDIYTLIDNKFSHQVRKITHNNHLASLKEYYLSSIDKLKKGNNCYLLSYDQGVKVLEQAFVLEQKDINPYLKLVNVNNDNKGYKKENSINNDYELIMSDIAYLLNIDYAKTYRIFDENMDPKGILNISFEKEHERFLNLEEALRFIKEESTKFTLTQEIINVHDKNIRYGLKEIHSKEEYKENIEYVIKLFKALPDITDKNVEELKKDYLNMKIFELLTNSLNNNLSNIGIIINKETSKYTYRLSPSYNKYNVDLPTIASGKTICNFNIVSKRELLNTLINNYYRDIKELLSLIVDNQKTLIPIINQVIKEHLEFDEYNKYSKNVSDNIKMITELVEEKKKKTPDTEEDEYRFTDNNLLYNNRVTPFLDNYVSDDYEEPNKGSVILTAIVTTVLIVTVAVILLAIYAVSKMNM